MFCSPSLPQVRTDAEQGQKQPVCAFQVVVGAVGQNIVDVPESSETLALEVLEERPYALAHPDLSHDHLLLQRLVYRSHHVGWCEGKREQPVQKPPPI
jgi:hypothetical protein